MIENFLISAYPEQKVRQKITQIFLDHFLEFVLHHKPKASLNISQKPPKDKFKYGHLKDRYNSQNYLIVIEDLIRKHNIYSGFDFEDNDDRINTSKAINRFHKEIETLFDMIINSHKKVIIYGAGVSCEIICAMYPKNVEFIIDSNTLKIGKKINNIDIYSPTKLTEFDNIYDCILISVLGREEEIIQSIKQKLKTHKEILTINC